MTRNRPQRALAALAASIALTLIGAGAAGAAGSDTASTENAPMTRPQTRGDAQAPAGAFDALTRGPRARANAVEATPDATIDEMVIPSGVLYTGGFNELFGSVAITLADGVEYDFGPEGDEWPVWSVATVNGVEQEDLVPLYWNNNVKNYVPGVDLPGQFGPGRINLGPSAVFIVKNDERSMVIDETTEGFYFRKDTFGTFRAARSGSKVTFAIKAQVRNSSGARGSARYGYVQEYKGGSWTHVRKIRLDSYGRGYYSISKSSKRYYRFVVKKTTTVQGMTLRVPKI